MGELTGPVREPADPSIFTGNTRKDNRRDGGTTNPFSSRKSGYGHIVDGTFLSVYPPGSEMYDFHTTAQEYIQRFIRDPKFPCIFGQAAIKSDQCSISAYDDITDPAVAEGVL